ncbi:hypothetical protein D3C75_531240 [compost metagenome]
MIYRFKQLRDFFWQLYSSLYILSTVQHIQQKDYSTLQLKSLTHSGAKQSRQTVHSIVPARLVAFHLHTHAVRVKRSKFIQSKRQHLHEQIGVVNSTLPTFGTQPMGISCFPFQLMQLLLILQEGAILPGFSVTNYILLTTWQHICWAVIERISTIPK